MCLASRARGVGGHVALMILKVTFLPSLKEQLNHVVDSHSEPILQERKFKFYHSQGHSSIMA